MRRILLLLMFGFGLGGLVVLGLEGCSPSIKLRAEHTDIDPNLQPYVNEYKELARLHNVKFNHTVTAGFKQDLGYFGAVGLTTTALTFREIDIKTNTWYDYSYISRMSLMYHELSHGMCERGHTYSDGVLYPNKVSPEVDTANLMIPPVPGHYPDGCPLSLMAPFMVDDYCTLRYYSDYTAEMFKDCTPY